jgi:hypothetical protein
MSVPPRVTGPQPAFTSKLDPEIAALCDAAACWMSCAAVCSIALGVLLTRGIEALKVRERLHTGYMPKAQRNAVAHGLYSMGVRKPRPRKTHADRVREDDIKFGLIEAR